MPLEAATVDELTRVASEKLRGEFFVPYDQPFPGGRVRVEAASANVAAAAVRGVATVRAAVRDGRKGLMARLINLDADSVRIPLGGLAPVVRVPTALPLAAPMARKEKITRPQPIVTPPPEAMKAALGNDDFDEAPATQASTLPEQVARTMKTPPPGPQPNVIRRNTPLPFPAVRPPTAQALAAPAPAPRTPTPRLEPEPEPEPELEEEVEAQMPDLVIEEKSLPVKAPAPEPVVAEVVSRPRRVSAPPPRASMRPGQIMLADVAASGPAIAPRRSRRRIVIAAAAGAAVLTILALILVPSGDSAAGGPSAVDEHLVQADARMRDGRLTGPGGDQALDHLLAARKLAPDDARVHDRLAALADTFERLADGAIAAGDLAEAAAHLQAAINAQPDRATATTKMRDVEQRARDRQAGP
ncbi:MAG TPA: hypothetical protein VMZ28_04020 [Kofleriaceae bacterium]|nr:hypothetical protein [Kofleriaceae bacterium]